MVRTALAFLGVLVLHGLVWSLPFWNPYPMGIGEIVAWYIIFGGAVIYITYYVGHSLGSNDKG